MVDCDDFDNNNKENDYDYELNEDGRVYKRVYNDESNSEEDSLHSDKSFVLGIKQKSIITAVVGVLLFYWIISTTTFSDIMGLILFSVLLCWIFF